MNLKLSLQPKSTLGTVIIFGILIKVVSALTMGTLPKEATDSLSGLGNLLLFLGLIVWLAFISLAIFRNVNKI